MNIEYSLQKVCRVAQPTRQVHCRGGQQGLSPTPEVMPSFLQYWLIVAQSPFLVWLLAPLAATAALSEFFNCFFNYCQIYLEILDIFTYNCSTSPHIRIILPHEVVPTTTAAPAPAKRVKRVFMANMVAWILAKEDFAKERGWLVSCCTLRACLEVVSLVKCQMKSKIKTCVCITIIEGVRRGVDCDATIADERFRFR